MPSKTFFQQREQDMFRTRLSYYEKELCKHENKIKQLRKTLEYEEKCEKNLRRNSQNSFHNSINYSQYLQKKINNIEKLLM